MLQVMQDGMPGTQIIILGIYPRGQDFADNAYMWPNHFTYSIEILNALYEVLLAPTWLVLCAQFQQLHAFVKALAVPGMVIPCTSLLEPLSLEAAQPGQQPQIWHTINVSSSLIWTA